MLLCEKTFQLDYMILNDIDYQFIKLSSDFSTSYPIKWEWFVNIICSQAITFFRDFSAIIYLNDLSYEKVEVLFTILKRYLNSKIIEKIIFKKEFIIIHFNQLFHMKLLTSNYMLYSFKFYKYLLKKHDLIKIYLCCTLKTSNFQKLIPFVIKYQNKFYLFDNNPNYQFNQFNNLEIIYLYKKKRKGYEKYRSLQLLHSNETIFHNLIKILI